jgi:nucleoside-diphosphate-sugar epimerase
LSRRVSDELRADPEALVVSPDHPPYDALVHLGGPEGAADALDAAAKAGAQHVVHLSTATVYGAWPDNPVPLSEAAPLRPNPGFAFAARHAEAERRLAEWKDDHPGVTVAVLRPAIVVGGELGSLAGELAGVRGLRPADASRPVQFVHEDDVASAVLVALRSRLDGVFNVAPDGWAPDETARELAGGWARLHVPERLASALAAAARVVGVGPAYPGVEPYTRHPWVVANDRLRSAGWAPAHSNEEAFVAGTGERRRLGVTMAAAAVAAAIVILVRRRISRT